MLRGSGIDKCVLCRLDKLFGEVAGHLTPGEFAQGGTFALAFCYKVRAAG